MDFLSNGDFWTIVAVLVSALGVHRAMKADRRREWQEFRAEIGKRFEEAEKRREAGEKRLAEQIDRVRQELGQRIDRGKRELGGVEQKLGHRIDGVEEKLGHRIDGVEERLGHRIDRIEDRMNENHREVSAGLAETKAAVSDLRARLDERSSPRRLTGADLPGSVESVRSGAVVREPSGDYSEDEPRDAVEPEEAPKGRRSDIAEERSDRA